MDQILLEADIAARVDDSTPRLSAGTMQNELQLSSGIKINIVQIPKINFIVVTDANNFGPNWFQVVYSNRVVTVRSILGGNEDVYSPIARCWFQALIESKSNVFNLVGNANSVVDAGSVTRITMNISLRQVTTENVRQVASFLRSL